MGDKGGGEDYPHSERPPQKRTIYGKYRLITCLPMMWKIQTAQISEELYYWLVSGIFFPKNIKDATRDQEEQFILSTLISISLRKTKRDGKM